jgi:hypothetical protein
VPYVVATVVFLAAVAFPLAVVRYVFKPRHPLTPAQKRSDLRWTAGSGAFVASVPIIGGFVKGENLTTILLATLAVGVGVAALEWSWVRYWREWGKWMVRTRGRSLREGGGGYGS